MTTLAQKRHQVLCDSLADADVLLIVPPFAWLRYPSLGVHLLQACCCEAGVRVHVFYANLALASWIGEDVYERICAAPMSSFTGERLFARAAYRTPPLGRRASRMFEPSWEIDAGGGAQAETQDESKPPISVAELHRVESHLASFLSAIACAISERRYAMVGCTSIFEQTAASIALLNRIKRLRPQTVTLLGGANCEGEMAQGIASLGARVDYIFSGESEATFPKFARAILSGKRLPARIIQGPLCRDLDALPSPRYLEFFEQRARFLPSSRLEPHQTEMLYETSRGCWWGEKQHCTFCGLNGEGMAFRQKSPDHVIAELRTLVSEHPTRRISMTDNIMPHAYFKTLVPRLPAELPGISIFYEQKANLSLAHLLALARAGITWIQPGIEALSSRLLRRMRKGVLARQNLLLLRNARAADIRVSWNLLWGFPGDAAEDYAETLAFIPLLHHLPPPDGLWHISIDRFSPYFTQPESSGIQDLRPLGAYKDFLPRNADVQRLAYHFMGDYESGAHRRFGLIQRLHRAVARWQAVWPAGATPPTEELRLSKSGSAYLLTDTRSVAARKKTRRLDEMEAAALLRPRVFTGSERENRVLAEKFAVLADGWFLPLVVAEPELLLQLGETPPAAEIVQPGPLAILRQACAP